MTFWRGILSIFIKVSDLCSLIFELNEEEKIEFVNLWNNFFEKGENFCECDFDSSHKLLFFLMKNFSNKVSNFLYFSLFRK